MEGRRSPADRAKKTQAVVHAVHIQRIEVGIIRTSSGDRSSRREWPTYAHWACGRPQPRNSPAGRGAIG